MTILVYDGTFEGLLTCVFEAYYNKLTPEKILTSSNLQQSFLDEIVNIETDFLKAEKVYKAIKSKISFYALQTIYRIFLSELEDSGIIIYKYIKAGFKLGRLVDNNLSDFDILTAVKISRKVFGEYHRMLGLLRFKEIKKDLYYAPYSPDFNITGLISPHFCDRLNDKCWIIHDTKRNLAAFFNKEEWIISSFDLSQISNLNEGITDYEVLWKKYFLSISIENKKNLKLQMKNMPKKYWDNLTEKQI